MHVYMLACLHACLYACMLACMCACLCAYVLCVFLVHSSSDQCQALKIMDQLVQLMGNNMKETKKCLRHSQFLGNTQGSTYLA